MRKAAAMDRPDPPAGDALTVEAVYDEHFAFVWRTLRALGVTEHQVEDALQDVFVVVHRRLAGFEGRSTLRSWLFAICRHTAQAYRRRAHRAHRDNAELPDEVPDPRAPSPRAGAEHNSRGQFSLSNILHHSALYSTHG
jgi:RNA polymerase sigma-70 factor, ECF subfamily